MNTESSDITASTHPYDSLTPEVILDAMEDAGFEVSGRLFALNSYENRVYQVGLEEGPPVITKFYRPGRWSDAAIMEEHEFSLELQAADIPVIAPMIMENGESLGRHGDFRFAVFPQRGGQAPDTSITDTLYRLGQWLGQIHNLGATKSFQHRPGFDLVQGIQDHNALLVDGGWVPDDLRPAWDSLIPDLVRGCQQRIEEAGVVDTLRIHGDCHAGNILCRDETMLFVDLDDCRTGIAMQDLWMLADMGGRDQEPGEAPSREMSELLEGYETMRPLPHPELGLVEPLRTLRMIHYCGWLVQRWDDPAFKLAFPWFGTSRYWQDQVLYLREQMARLQG